jgi:hypothetical protein
VYNVNYSHCADLSLIMHNYIYYVDYVNYVANVHHADYAYCGNYAYYADYFVNLGPYRIGSYGSRVAEQA